MGFDAIFVKNELTIHEIGLYLHFLHTLVIIYMMKRILLLGVMAVFMFYVNALDVTNTAGELHLHVTDLNVT